MADPGLKRGHGMISMRLKRLFARVGLSPPKVSPAVRQLHPEAMSIFKDVYDLEFFGLPEVHAEANLHQTLLEKLKDFIRFSRYALPLIRTAPAIQLSGCSACQPV